MVKPQCELPGQFILLQDSQYVPVSWHIRQKECWLLATHPSLPVIDIFSKDAIHLGWLLGYPISLDAQLINDNAVFQFNFNHYQIRHNIETCLYEFGGRFLAIFITDTINSVYLDPCGSLAVVYSLEQPIIASTTTLIPFPGEVNDYNNDLIEKLGMPASNKWYPAGLTPRKRSRRLLPNHFLDLDNFQESRHWPESSTMKINPDINKPVKSIIKLIKNNIHAVAKSFPLHIALTGGRDSRLLLACAKELANSIVFFTISDQAAVIDCHLASKIAQRFHLNHRLLSVESATAAQLDDWLYRSGSCVSGRVWQNHQTMRHLDVNRAVLLGLAGELGRGVYRRKGDTEYTQLTPEEILKRLRIPPEGEILATMRDWWAEIAHFNAYTILDLTLIEQRLGCWGGPQHYGRIRTNTPLLFPFCHRHLFELMLQLPHEYRQQKQLTIDILEQEWPELLSLPFNHFTGIRAYTHSVSKAFKKLQNQ